MANELDQIYLSDIEWDTRITSGEYWDYVNKEKLAFFRSNKEYPGALIRPMIADSWKRARARGLDPFSYCPALYPEIYLDDHKLALKRKEYYLLYEVCRAMAASYIELAKNTGYSLEIFDPGGGHLFGSHFKFQGNAEAIAMDWKEDVAGTMTHFLAMEYRRPVCTIGPEIMLDYFQDTISICAPILGDRQQVMGTVLLSQQLGPTPWAQIDVAFQRHSLGWISAMAKFIEVQILLLEKQYQLECRNETNRAILESIGEAVVLVDKDGCFLLHNQEAAQLFGLATDTSGCLADFLPPKAPIREALSTGQKYAYFEQTLVIANKNVPYLVTIEPVLLSRTQAGQWTVLRFTPQKVINELFSRQRGAEAVYTFDDIIGENSQILLAKERARHFAATSENILLLGESGVGKEVFAQAIHNQYKPNGPFIAVNCSAIPRDLIESELFGYEKGAFTGAEKNGRVGKIEMAHGGTLFLDEIGSMPYDMQTVLLRVLQDKRLMRVGGKNYCTVNFRLITATNTDFLTQFNENTFRQDLFFRLAVLYVEIPPLRQRGQDVLLLAEYFIEQYTKKENRPAPALSREVQEVLLSYDWPGNVRQLQNALIYAINICNGDIIEVSHLPRRPLINFLPESDTRLTADVPGEASASKAVKSFLLDHSELNLEDMERRLINNALARTENNLHDASQLLGISYSALYRRLKKLSMQG